jgi:hypothetical protein
MSVYKIFPSKDATIYSNQPTINAGRDEVLEISSINNPEFIGATEGYDDIRRTLIQFADEDLELIKTLTSGSIFSSNLKLYLANASALPLDYTIECYPLAQSWVMGTGKFPDNPNPKNGVSWYTTGPYREGIIWNDIIYTHDYLYTTGGGTWNASYSGSQEFIYTSDKDLDINVTSIVDQWLSGSIPNYGFILKQADSLELSPSSSLETKFFSVDTRTIYPPCLEVKWDDSTYNTGSNTNGVIATDDFILLAENNVETYKEDTIYRFKFKTRDRFPIRNFTTSSEYLNWKYLPEQSYWAIQDYKTTETIIDFDNSFTKISANNTGNYFTVYMNGLQPERSYKILVKTILEDTNEEIIIDNDIIFKVGR